MRIFFFFMFVLFDLWNVFMMVSTGDVGFIIPLIMGVVVTLAIWTNTLHLIPGDTETELYRLRMMFEEENRNRRQR